MRESLLWAGSSVSILVTRSKMLPSSMFQMMITAFGDGLSMGPVFFFAVFTLTGMCFAGCDYACHYRAPR